MIIKLKFKNYNLNHEVLNIALKNIIYMKEFHSLHKSKGGSEGIQIIFSSLYRKRHIYCIDQTKRPKLWNAVTGSYR